MKAMFKRHKWYRRLGAAALAAAMLAGACACGQTPAESGGESSLLESSAPDSSKPDSHHPANSTAKPTLTSGSWTDQYEAPTSESLLSTGEKQNRYMTLPDSRVVVNPFNFESQARETTQVQYSNRPTMPINFGFCDPFMGEGRGKEVPNVVMMAEGKISNSTQKHTIWEADLNNKSAWSFSGTEGVDHTASIGGGKGTIGVCEGAETSWQHAEIPVNINVDNAFLIVTIDSISKADGKFAIKVTNGSPEDTRFIETDKPGTYTFKISDLTGWSGSQSFNLKIFAVNYGCQVTFSNVRIESTSSSYNDAAAYSTSWRPDQLGFEAAYSSGAKITGTDFFYDEKTVVRDMTLTNSKGLLIYGEYNGTASVSGNTVVIDCGNFKYAVTVSANVKPRFYSYIGEAKVGGKGNASPSGTAGAWAYQITSIPADGKVRVSVSFDTKLVSNADVAALSQKPGADCSQKLAERTAQWDELLSRVPRPGSFDLTDIDAKGVTAGQVRQSYYEAWVQVIGNVLPANPEVGYNYRSFATGKPSLWGYGSPKCSYAATWEALYGMSYYAQINADQAWEMYRGLMSLVDDKGQIAGESLPSNNARVAWMIYTAKPDQEALAEVQPWLTRHLQWRFDNPRWIYLDVTPDTQQKDIDFVAAALIDVQYLMRINEELGLESENAQWETKVEEMYQNMKDWFFSPLTTYPVQYFSLKDNGRGAGNALWVLKALHVPDVQDSEVQSMLRLLRTRYNPNMPFCAMGGIKYEPYIYTVWGLMEHGYMEEGRVLSQTALRDIVLCGIHSEGYNYAGTESVPLPEGVRPSMFGVAMVIDNVYMMNGVRMDDGMPVFANYFDRSGGVENFTVDGKIFSMKKEGDTFTAGGSYVDGILTMEIEDNTVGFPFENTHVHPLHG